MSMFPKFTVDDFQFLKSEYDIGVMLTELARTLEVISNGKEQFVCNALERPYNISEKQQPTCVTMLLKAIGGKLRNNFTLDGWLIDMLKERGLECSLEYVNMQPIRVDWLGNIRSAVLDRRYQLEAEYA